MIGLPYEEESLDTDRPCDDGGGDWRAVSTGQRSSRITGSHQKLGEKPGTESPSEPQEELACRHLDF